MLSRLDAFNVTTCDAKQLSIQIISNIEQGFNACDILYGLAKRGCDVISLLDCAEKFHINPGVIFEGYVKGYQSDKYNELIKTAQVDYAEIVYHLARNGQIEEIEPIISKFKTDELLFKLKQGMAEGGYTDYLMHYEELYSKSSQSEKIFFLKKMADNLHLKDAEKYRKANGFEIEIILNCIVSHAKKYGMLDVIKKINSDEHLSRIYFFALKAKLQLNSENIRFPRAGDYVFNNRQTLNELLSYCNPECVNDVAFQGIAIQVLDELIIKNSLRPSDVNNYLMPAVSAFYMDEMEKNNIDLPKAVFNRVKHYLNLEGYIEFENKKISFKSYPDFIADKILKQINEKEYFACKEHLAVQVRTYCGRYGFIMGERSIHSFIDHASKFIKGSLSDQVVKTTNEIQDIQTSLDEINRNLQIFKKLSKKKDKTEGDIKALVAAKSQLGSNNKLSKKLKVKLGRLNIKTLLTDGMNEHLFEALHASLKSKALINEELVLKLNLVGYRNNISKKLRRLNSLARLLSLESPVTTFKYKPKKASKKKIKSTPEEKILNNCIAVTVYNHNLFIATNSVQDESSAANLRKKIENRLESLLALFARLDGCTDNEKIRQVIQIYISDQFDSMTPVIKKVRIAKDIFKLYKFRDDLSWKNHFIDINLSDENGVYHAEQVLADKFSDVKDPIFIGIEKICCDACYNHLSKLNVIFSGGSNGRYGGLAFGEDKSNALPLRIAVYPDHEESASETSLIGGNENIFKVDLRASTGTIFDRKHASNTLMFFDISNARRQRKIGGMSKSEPSTLPSNKSIKSVLK